MSPATKDAKPPAARPPSLNQLAARINSTANTTSGSSAPAAPAPAAPRTRLAASFLRTSSSTALATVPPTLDAAAGLAPAARAASPAPTSTASPPPQSTTPASDTAAPGAPPTPEAPEQPGQGQETTEKPAAGPKPPASLKPAAGKKNKVGYKNIPSLDAITARLAKARALSVDGSARPPDAEMIEDPKSPGVPMKAPEHPLQFPWTIYHDTKSKFPFTPGGAPPTAGVAEGPSGPFSAAPPDTGAYEAGLTVIGEFDTVESFCRYFNWLKPPSKLERNSNYHLFKAGIKPMWEDAANAQGGKWVLTMKNNPALLDRCWSWLAMALVGEELEEGDEICGAVVSLRSKVDRIQVWTRRKDDVERLNGIGRKLVKLLDVSEADSIGLEFQYNTDDRPLPSKFLAIQAMPATSYRATFAQAQGGPKAGGAAQSPVEGPGYAEPVPGSAAGGAFGPGLGAASVWRTKRG